MSRKQKAQRGATLYGLGVGPGDPDLISLKAVKILQSVPVIAFVQTADAPSFARRIVAPHLPLGQQEVALTMPMSLNRRDAQPAYDAAAATIRTELSQGRDLAFLCEGDPFTYGSFMYLFGRLSGQVAVEVVPGITSVAACAAAAGMPLASRNDRLVLLPAPLPDEKLRQSLDLHEAVALMKMGRHLGRVKRLLQEMQLLAQAVYIEYGSLPQQKVLPLQSVREETAHYFSMILIHKRGQAHVF